MPEPTLFHWFQLAMALITIVPFLGVFTRLGHSYRYATFMSSWSAGTLFWLFWLLERISTFEYFLSLAVTCFFPFLWFYRTRVRKPQAQRPAKISPPRPSQPPPGKP